MRYKYFIHYNITIENDCSEDMKFDENNVVILENPICSISDIRDIEETLEVKFKKELDEVNLVYVTIDNFIELKGE